MVGCFLIMLSSRLKFSRLNLHILCIITYSGATIAMSFSNSMVSGVTFDTLILPCHQCGYVLFNTL